MVRTVAFKVISLGFNINNPTLIIELPVINFIVQSQDLSFKGTCSSIKITYISLRFYLYFQLKYMNRMGSTSFNIHNTNILPFLISFLEIFDIIVKADNAQIADEDEETDIHFIEFSLRFNMSLCY